MMATQRVNMEWKGKPIIVYKANSRGVVLGEYNCLYEFARLEAPFRENSGINAFNSCVTGIQSVLSGRCKYLRSFYYQTKISIKLKK